VRTGLVRLSAPSVLLSPEPLAFPAEGLAKGNAPLLALGYKVALFLGVAQDPVPGNFFPKTLEQAFWRLSGSQCNFCQLFFPYLF
jgi:hypothetical protein